MQISFFLEEICFIIIKSFKIRTSNILQKYIYGQKSHKYEVYCYEPNFKNENLSVELPIFIIHGNHDDPSGIENISSIDIFANKE